MIDRKDAPRRIPGLHHLPGVFDADLVQRHGDEIWKRGG